MNDDKERRNIDLAADRDVRQLLDLVTKNWEVAKSRMAQIAQEREDGINIDNGVEVMAVYARMERVYEYLYCLLHLPQAYLLPSVINGLRPFVGDTSVDAEIMRLTCSPTEINEEEKPDFLTTPPKYLIAPSYIRQIGKDMLTDLTANHIIGYLDSDGKRKVMKSMDDILAIFDEDDKPEQRKESFLGLGKKLAEVVNDNRRQLVVGLMFQHVIIEFVCKLIDMQSFDDADVASVFERAKQQLLESKAWHEYWANHKQHLERKGGSLDEQWKEDAAEVEEWLRDVRGYIYNRWNESPEAFGQALKREQLDDRDMLLLLFYLAKKDAIARETEKPDERRETMEDNAPEAAMKQPELPAELLTEEAQKYWKRLREAGFIVADGYALAEGISANQAAYIAACMADKLRLMYKWKPFQQLWGIKTLAQLSGTWRNTGKFPSRYMEIERLMQ
jgi:hypothetical protein